MAIHFKKFAQVKTVLFRIFYSTTFTIVFLLVISFACAGTIDSIYQSYRRRRLIDVFSIAGAYILTGLISIFLYSSRLYTNRSLLRDIPKTYMPTDKGEVGNRRMWKLIEDCKSRSAVAAYLTRPRSRRIELEVSSAGERISTLLKPEHSKEKCEYEPQWGTINHPGWASPAAKETPNLEYDSVIRELLDLVEARAVSLTPLQHHGQDTLTDEEVIEALQRPEIAGMRDYILQLVELDVLDYDHLTVTFLKQYEQARFGPEPLTDLEFRTLMRVFAELLRNMRPLALADARLETVSVASRASTTSHTSSTRRLEEQHSASNRAGSIKSSGSNTISQGSVRRHHIDHNDQIFNISFLTTADSIQPPRISNDSVRSLSPVSAYHDMEDQSWIEPTSRPPFFRSRSSTSARSRGSRNKVNRVRHRSRLRRAMSRASIVTNSTGPSLKSAMSNGSVIRLNPDYNGSHGQLPFEYLDTVPLGGPSSNTAHPRRNEE